MADNLFNIGGDASNGFGGTTYAGFSPQAHQGANLLDPMNAKYALQQYLVQNGALTGGPSGNAKAIAEALNQQYGEAYGNPNFFQATDAETIVMPDGTYVHAAPNGYGMAAGTFDPSNTNEVFWGAMGGAGQTGSVSSPTWTGAKNDPSALMALLTQLFQSQPTSGPSNNGVKSVQQDAPTSPGYQQGNNPSDYAGYGAPAPSAASSSVPLGTPPTSTYVPPYVPPNNTGVSGYGPGGVSAPPLAPAAPSPAPAAGGVDTEQIIQRALAGVLL